MKLPWTKEAPVVVPQPPMISDEEMAAREAEWQAKLKERVERTARIPENLVGYRLSHGCTCGADAERIAREGSLAMISSMPTYHKDDCEVMNALYVQVIEVEDVPVGALLRAMVSTAHRAPGVAFDLRK